MFRLSVNRKWKLWLACALCMSALLIVTCCAWVFSYVDTMTMQWRYATPLPPGTGFKSGALSIPMEECTGIMTRSGWGGIALTLAHGPDWRNQPFKQWRFSITRNPPEYPGSGSSIFNRAGFGWRAFEFDTRTLLGTSGNGMPNFPALSHFLIWMPYWFLALILAIATAASGRAAWKQRWLMGQNLCPYCAYDLRESTGACPECGSAKPASSSSNP